MRSLIARETDDGEFADSLNYGQLKHYGSTILAIAKDVLAKEEERLAREKILETKVNV